MIYQYEEIELTLKLSYFAKIHLGELERILQTSNDKKYTDDYIYYSHIINIVDSWLKSLFPDEQEIIILRILKNQTYNHIAFQIGYLNHSSVIRKYKGISKNCIIIKKTDSNLYLKY